ncbi:hypothetical protein CPB84DRAFT_1853496 [Gymnopilus junonius]|uniref:Uncharacterized protein n=1 Tax=Gymnopilus junonius TaxID=109634 RepID=A0A9P5N9U2_GYMJU|nr:hypothetical protein CPB84DRAFT_1853496 [Gymnopilus junonius]
MTSTSSMGLSAVTLPSFALVVRTGPSLVFTDGGRNRYDMPFVGTSPPAPVNNTRVAAFYLLLIDVLRRTKRLIMHNASKLYGTVKLALKRLAITSFPPLFLEAQSPAITLLV